MIKETEKAKEKQHFFKLSGCKLIKDNLVRRASFPFFHLII